jgi:hypothetical protein
MNGLFKYFPVDLDKIDTLASQKILLTPPKYFNDPWDFLVRREPITEDEIRAQFVEFQRERPTDLTFDKFKTGITRPEFVNREGPDMQAGLSERFGVVSLTSDPYNRLMWGYYADSHRGFVAQFAHEAAMETNGIETAPCPFGLAVKVTYALALPRVKADFSNSVEVYCTKHEEWRHEDEWRVIEYLKAGVPEPRNGKTFYLLRFNPKDLVRVIFGLRVDPTVEKRLTEMLDTEEFAHVKREEMKIDPSSGKLTSSDIR